MDFDISDDDISDDEILASIGGVRKRGPAPKTHCSKGHAFTPENTRYRKGTLAKVCKECQRIASAASKKKHPAAHLNDEQRLARNAARRTYAREWARKKRAAEKQT